MPKTRMISYSQILWISHFFSSSGKLFICYTPYSRFRGPPCPGKGWLATVTFYGYPKFFQGMLFSAIILIIPLFTSPLHCYTRFMVPMSRRKVYCYSQIWWQSDFFWWRMLLSVTTALHIHYILHSMIAPLYMDFCFVESHLFLELVCLSCFFCDLVDTFQCYFCFLSKLNFFFENFETLGLMIYK